MTEAEGRGAWGLARVTSIVLGLPDGLECYHLLAVPWSLGKLNH